MQNEHETREQLVQKVDILRRRVAELEAAQAESERRHEATLRALLERVPLGVHMYDLHPDGRLVFAEANPAADRILGVDNAQFIGQTIEDAFPPLIETEVPERYRRAAAEGIPWETEQIVYEDGAIAGAFQVCAFQVRPGSVAALFLDVTEHRRLEAQIQQTNARLERQLSFTEALLAAVPTPVFFKDAEGRYLGCNDAFTEQTGVSAGEMKGKTVYDLWPGEHAEVYHRKDLELIQHPQHQIYEFQVRDKTGRDRDVIFAGNVFYDESSRVAGLVGAYIDITERKQAEEALRESEERLRLFIEHAPVALAMFDREMRYLAVSHRWLANYRFEDRDVLGRSHYELLPEIPDRWKIAHRRGLAGEVVRADEDHFVRTDGTVRWMRWEVRPWHAANGAIGGIVIFTEDITGRKQAEEALRESERRYRLLAENATDVIWTMDLNLRSTYTSPSVKRLRGYDAEEAMAQSLKEALTPASFEIVSETLAEELALDKMPGQDPFRSRTLELEVLRKDGSTVWTEATVTFLRDPDGEPIEVLGVTRDITHRKRAGESLRESEARFRELADLLPQVVCEADGGGNLTYVNRMAFELFGYTQQDFERGVNVFQMLAPEDRERAVHDIRDIGGGAPPEGGREYCALRKDGSTFPALIYTSPIVRQDRVAGLRGLVVDITAQKQAEWAQQQLLDRVQRQQATVVTLALHRAFVAGNVETAAPTLTRAVAEAMDVARVSVWLLENEETELYCRDLYLRCQDTHTSGQVLAAADFPAYFSALKQDRAIDAHDARTDPRTREFTGAYLEPNGITSMLDAAIRLHGRVVGVVCHEHIGEPRVWQPDEVAFAGQVADQMSQALANAERRRDQDRLRASEVRYRTLVEQSLQGMVIAQNDPVRLVFASRPMQAICGFSPQELTSFEPQQLAELIHPEDRGTFFARFRAGLTGEPVPPRHEYRVIHKSGEVRWVELYSMLIEHEGSPATQAVFLDVTARKQAEEALRVSLEKYRVLFEAFPLGITVSDEAGKILEGNRASERLLGISAREHGRRQIDGPEWQIVRPDGAPMPVEEYASVRALSENRLVENVEMGIVKPGGDTVWINVTAAPIPLEGYGVAVAYGDITSRVQAQNALRERETYFRTLFEYAGDAIFIEDEADRIVDANHRACELLGYTREELLNMTIAEMQAPERRGQVGSIIKGELAEHKGQLFETLDLRKDGTRVPVEVTTVPLMASEGNLALSIVRDASERMQAQRALRQERDLSRALADAAAAVSRTLDPDEVLDRLLEQVSSVIPNDAANVMLIEGVNRVRIARWRGYERFGAEAFVSTVVFDLDAVPNLRQMTESGEPMVIPDTAAYPGWVHVPEQAWLRSYAGVPIRVRDVTVGFLNVDSATPGFFTPQHAATLRAFADHATMALQNARLYQGRMRAERLLSALNRAALAIARVTTTGELFDAAAGELRPLGLTCIVFMLDESKSYLHPVYTSHETVQAGASEDLTGLGYPRFAIPIRAIRDEWQVLLDRQAMLIEDTEGEPPGTDRRFAGDIVCQRNTTGSIVATLFVEERVIGLFVVQGESLTQDDLPTITAFAHQVAVAWHKADLMQSLQDSLVELKRTQAQLVQAQKMEAIGRLAGGVAHDFNNHLTAIHGYAEMVLLELDPRDPRREDVREIQHAAERSADLTRQLLAFSRKQVIRPQVLDLNDLIETMRKMLGRLIGEDIELRTTFGPELGLVRADPGQIEQVVMNLAVNARDAIDERIKSQTAPFVARLTIETANVELDEAYAHDRVEVAPGVYVMLAVSDNGIGMDEETMSHLFEPFFTTKEQGKGTGLGLATVYGIVKQNGGYVFPYSEPGAGTTFKVYLPRVDAAAEPVKQTDAQTATTRGSETILLVEDEDAVRALARRILVGRGYRVLEAANADDAFRLCEQRTGPIHLVLTDVVVPGLLSSKELVDRIVKARPEIAVVYMSGYTDDVIAHHGVLDPGIQFVGKPFTPNALALKVREVLDGRSTNNG